MAGEPRTLAGWAAAGQTAPGSCTGQRRAAAAAPARRGTPATPACMRGVGGWLGGCAGGCLGGCVGGSVRGREGGTTRLLVHACRCRATRGAPPSMAAPDVVPASCKCTLRHGHQHCPHTQCSSGSESATQQHRRRQQPLTTRYEEMTHSKAQAATQRWKSGADSSACAAPGLLLARAASAATKPSRLRQYKRRPCSSTAQHSTPHHPGAVGCCFCVGADREPLDRQ